MIDHTTLLSLFDECNKDKSKIPSLEWLKENVTPCTAWDFWAKDPITYKPYLDAFRATKPKHWEDFPSSIVITPIKEDVDHPNFKNLYQQAKAKTFIPTLEWCKENVSLRQASELWGAYGSEHFKAEFKCYRDTKPAKIWHFFKTPENIEQQKQAAKRAKDEKRFKVRQKGGLGTQSKDLKEKLAKPISFKHESGISVTILNCNSVTEIAQELNKISFVHYTNLSKIINGTAQSTKGWRLYVS